MNTPDTLRLTGAKIDACTTLTPVSGDLRDAAAALLTELFTVGLRRGITPADWAGVADLPTSCLDACRQRYARAATRDGTPPRWVLTRPTSTELACGTSTRDRSQGWGRGR